MLYEILCYIGPHYNGTWLYLEFKYSDCQSLFLLIIKPLLVSFQIFKKDSVLNALLASMASGVLVVIFMTPPDVVSTRLYNQGVDANGRGLFYSGTFDCFKKIFLKEGIWGFYKGWAASLFRIGPHTVLSLVFWDQTRRLYLSYTSKEES